MAGMKRFVTYIYSYDNGKKGGNAGFAKIEIRGNECRIEIHLRGLYMGHMTCKVYLFRPEGEEITGFPIGEISVRKGAGDFGTIVKAVQIGNSPFSITDMEGIFLVGDDDRILMSRWKEGAALQVSKEKFKEWGAVPAQERRDMRQEPVSQEVIQEKSAEVQSESEAVQRETLSEESALLSEEAALQKSAESALLSEKEALQKSALESTENVTATEIPMKNIFPQYTWQQTWENLKAAHPVFTPFDNEKIACVRIELKDLRDLPKRYWYFGNNSFLLHGFFNYHYLIIGKSEEDRWFLGVPGIYQRQEHVMAAIFGFPEFLPAALSRENEKNSEEPINRFGYWFRYIEE